MHLRRMTEADKRARDGLEEQQWEAERLSAAEFLAREAQLRAHAWARDAIDCWLLVADDGTPLSSCATYRLRAWHAGSAGTVWAVTNVFTEPRLRRQGHATRLMDRLVERARHDGLLAAILFSDVGAPLYERSGFVIRPAADLKLTPSDGDPAANVDALLDAIALPPPSSPSLPSLPSSALTIWPTAAQLDWHLERMRTFAALRNKPPLPWLGARAGTATIHWSIDWKAERLRVLLLDAAGADEGRALVEAARRIAGTLGLGEVRLWEQPWQFSPAALGGERVARKHSLPMIAPLVPSLSPDAWTNIPYALWL